MAPSNKSSNKKFTISDIAKSAGVSKTTVSRYINGKFEYMSEETRKRIEMIIQVANFHPNRLARSLKSQKSRLIGLVIADIESPFSASIIKGVGDYLQISGYNMIIVNSDNNVEKEQESINSLISQQVDGLIVNTTTRRNPFLIDLANKGLPIVLADRFVEDYNFDIAYIECRHSMHTALQHLHEQGYGKKFLFIQSYDTISPRLMRREAFVEWITKQGVSQPEKYIFVVNLADENSVSAALKKVLTSCEKDEAPPAIMTTNGVTLLHIVNAVQTMKVRIPQQLGICGYDDWGWTPAMDWTSMIAPGITALVSQSHILGELSVKMLIERMKHPEHPKKKVTIPAELVVRGSTQLKK
jgi:LacI family kdg operon repressor